MNFDLFMHLREEQPHSEKWLWASVTRKYPEQLFTTDWTLHSYTSSQSLAKKWWYLKLGSHTERRITRKWKLFDLFKCISSHTSALTKMLHATHCCNTMTTQHSIWQKSITSVISDKYICQSFLSWQRLTTDWLDLLCFYNWYIRVILQERYIKLCDVILK